MLKKNSSKLQLRKFEIILKSFIIFLSGYYVEKRERGGEWIKVNNYPTPNTSYTVQDLREGNRYEFRVIAVNEAGPGKPSKPTEPLTAQAQRRKS